MKVIVKVKTRKVSGKEVEIYLRSPPMCWMFLAMLKAVAFFEL